MSKVINILGLLLILVLGCANDSEEDLVEITPVTSNENVTYNSDIKIILDGNCLNCHDSTPTNGANISLNTFSGAISGVNNNNLIERISKLVGESGAMPLGGPRLPQNLINLVDQWKNDGLLEN